MGKFLKTKPNVAKLPESTEQATHTQLSSVAMSSGTSRGDVSGGIKEIKKEEATPVSPIKKESSLTTKIEVKDEPLSDGETASSPAKPGSSGSKTSGSKHKLTAGSGNQSEKPAKEAKHLKSDNQPAEQKLIDGKTKEEIETEERERMQHLVSNFTEDQLDRYEMYRRAAFPKVAIKRIMQGLTGSSVGQNVVIAMSGISKVFAGEVVEEALDYMDQLGETGPLKPKHLREAARRLRSRDVFPRTKKRSVL